MNEKLIKIEPAEHNAELFRALINNYFGEISAFNHFIQISVDGIYEPELVDSYFSAPDIFPYIIYYSGRDAGIVIISQKPCAPAGCDWCVNELYIRPELRRKGIAAASCALVCSHLRGKIGLHVLKTNGGANRYWSNWLSSRKNLRKQHSGKNLLLYEFDS